MRTPSSGRDVYGDAMRAAWRKQDGTKANPVRCYDAAEAQDCARERGKPVVVTLDYDPNPPHPEAALYKVYPSGLWLWAYDVQNPFQHFSGFADTDTTDRRGNR